MLHVDLDEKNSIAVLRPDESLSKDDFLHAGTLIDPLIEKAGKLHGLIIYTETFPGWESFEALSSHFKFVNDHHQDILAVAFVTDSMLGTLAERVAKHFVSAKIKNFSYNEFEDAKAWITMVNQNDQ